MRTPSYDPAALEAEIGPRGSTMVNSDNRAKVQNWLVAQGIPSARTKSMKLATLWKFYNRPNYLPAVLSRIGTAGPALDIDDATAADLAEIAATETGAFETMAPAVTTPAAALPMPSDAGSQLAMLIQSLAAGAINESRVIELIALHAPAAAERVVERIVIDRGADRIALPEGLRHREFATVLAAVLANVPLMLVGPAGSGKTTLCGQVAEAIGRPFAHCGAITSRYDLSGFIDAQGRYQRTAFRDAFEHGWLFLFDEFDGSDESAVLWANAALANGFCAFPDGPVKRHPDFRFIAACNTYGRGQDRVYNGRSQLDGATLDRFATLAFGYDEDLEAALFAGVPMPPRYSAVMTAATIDPVAWVARVQSVRGAIAEHGLRYTVSPRATDYGRRLLGAGLPQALVEDMVIFKGMAAADRDKIEHAARGRRAA